MIKIPESDMIFGPFEDNDVFYIEKSQIYQRLQQKMQIAEFLLTRTDNSIWIIEAKSSSPNPGNKDSQLKFDEFILDISQKLMNALTLTISTILGRHERAKTEVPKRLEKCIFNNCTIKLILVIKGHHDEWLIPIKDALTQQLYTHTKVWRFDIAVINDATARDQKLIC